MKLLLIVLAGLLGFSIVAEVGLRLTQGLGNPPLYIADRDIGYLLAPNQKLRRGGNLIEINQYSMRDRNIKPQKQQGTKRIFLLGDSVVNGSWWTAQSDILANLLAKKLQAGNSKESLEVFNASTNSWGPRNELAYIKRYGLFEADTLILVINTEDLFSTKATSAVVGKSYSYPSKPPALALIELYQLYIAPPRQIPELEKLRAQTQANLKANLEAVKEIKAIAEQSGTEFILVLTPLLKEFKEGSTAEEQQARDSLQKLVTQDNINYLDFLQIWSDFPQPEFLYRDRIHPSPQGNTKIIEQLSSVIEKQ